MQGPCKEPLVLGNANIQNHKTNGAGEVCLAWAGADMGITQKSYPRDSKGYVVHHIYEYREREREITRESRLEGYEVSMWVPV